MEAFLIGIPQRLLMEELQMEQRAQVRRNDSKKQMERNLLVEMERLQRDIDLAKQSTDLHHLTVDTLRKEVRRPVRSVYLC